MNLKIKGKLKTKNTPANNKIKSIVANPASSGCNTNPINPSMIVTKT